MKTKNLENDNFSLRNITKSSVWELQENDVVRLCQAADKDQEVRESINHYLGILRTAFEMEELKIDKPEIIKKYENRGLKVSALPFGESTKKWGIKKRPIVRVTDLTYENIHHISAIKLLEVIDRNFGGGWESLSQSIRDIILKGFDVSTTTLPKDRLHNPGGMYETMLADGYEVLEIEKGAWIEAIFAKVKPVAEKLVNVEDLEIKSRYDRADDDEEDEDADLPEDTYNQPDEDDDIPDDDELTAESYRTTIDEDPESLDITVDDLDDDEY